MSENNNVTKILEERGNRYGTFEANSELFPKIGNSL